MTTPQRVIRNLFIVGGTQMVLWSASLIFTIVQARSLGPVGFGELSLAISYGAVLIVVIDFGLSTQLARMVAKDLDGPTALWSTLAARAAIWVLALPALFVVVRLLGYRPELANTILILGASLLFIGLSSAIGAYFQGREDFRLASLAALAQRVGGAAVGILLLMNGAGVETIAWVLFGSAALNAAIMCTGLIRVRVGRISARATLALVRSALPIAGYWIVGSIYFNIDMVLLERLAPAENVGWYAAAYRLFNAAGIIPALLCGTVLYPVLSRLAKGPSQELRGAMRRSCEMLAICGTFAAVALFVLPGQVVAVLYPRFEGSVEALRLLAPGLLALYFNSVFAFTLLGLGFERRMFVMAAFMAVANPVANAVLIPVYAQDASAALTSATEVALLVWLVSMTPRELRPWEALRPLAKTALAGTLTAGVLALTSPLGLLPAIAIGLGVYAVALRALDVVPQDDLRELVRLARGPRLAREGGPG